MNKPIAAKTVTPAHDQQAYTLGLDALLAKIAEGEAERERERTLPHPQIDLIRQARLGARLAGIAVVVCAMALIGRPSGVD